MNKLEMLTNDEGINNFAETGVVVLENIFSNSEILYYRQICEDILKFNGSETKTQSDAVTKNESLWSLIDNKKILSYIRKLIPGDIIYTQHSDVHINLGTGAFHRDSREKRFDPTYCLSDEIVLRIALYIEDRNHNIGGILVIPGSHKQQSYLQNKELSFYNRIRKFMRKFNLNEYFPLFSILSCSINIAPSSGSVIIFDQRVVHAGLPPIRKSGTKYSVFWSYGSSSLGTRKHVDFYRKKSSYLNYIPDKLKTKLKQSSILCY